MSLKTYKQKRNFQKTTEPDTEIRKSKGGLIFVVQKHHASHLHFDFRLELDGVLKSWAVPKGPSMNPRDKRLAMMVEDHPYDYRTFEGLIPPGNYGAGSVIIFDQGNYSSIEGIDNIEALKKGLSKGDLKFVLNGEKLKGEFALVKTKDKNSWLLIKKKDQYATNKNITVEDAEPDIKPMLATLADKPFNDPAWIFEIKWDGYRTIAHLHKDQVELISRNGLSFNKVFIPVHKELATYNAWAVLDGEMSVLDEKGLPQFQLIQNYLKTGQGTLVYYVFDILYLNGIDLRSRPLLERKRILSNFIPESKIIKYSDYIIEKGIVFFKEAADAGLEGIIAKKADSKYYSNKRSQSWLKVKTQMRQEAIIAGFTKPRGSRKKIGALILGVYDENNELKYIGHTGGGFTVKSLNEVYERLEPLITEKGSFKTIPKVNNPATWVKPLLICEVAFQGWTDSGNMRHPIFLGLRGDKKTKDVKKELPMKKEVKKEGRLQLTNLDKVLWPKDGYTKSDLINYYDQMSYVILPYLKDRPESLHRHPNGIDKKGFYQKDLEYEPSWVETCKLHSESNNKMVNYLLCQNKETLLYMANLGCIEINPWNSRTKKLEYPDYMVIDLDPGERTSFETVIKVAQETRKLLEELNIQSYCKTSGATGLHVYVPLNSKYHYDSVRDFGKIIAYIVNSRMPEDTTIERSLSKRKGKLYIDYLQNRKGQTLAAPYSLRPREKAPVSTPLKWNEVKKGLEPTKFTMKNIFKRLDKVGDLWEGTIGKGINIEKALKSIESNNLI